MEFLTYVLGDVELEEDGSFSDPEDASQLVEQVKRAKSAPGGGAGVVEGAKLVEVAALREELRGLELRALQQRLLQLGLSSYADKPKDALIELLVARSP